MPSAWKRIVRGALLGGDEGDLSTVRASIGQIQASGLTLGELFNDVEQGGLAESGVWRDQTQGEGIGQILTGAGTGGAIGAGIGAGAGLIGGPLAPISVPIGATAGLTIGASTGAAAGFITSLNAAELHEKNAADWIQEQGGVDSVKTQLERSDFGAIVSRRATQAAGEGGSTSFSGDFSYLNLPSWQSSISQTELGAGSEFVQPQAQSPGAGFQPLDEGLFPTPEQAALFNALGAQFGAEGAISAFAALGGQGGAFNTPTYQQLIERQDQQQQLANTREDARLDQQRQDNLHQINTGFSIDRQRLGNEQALGNRQLDNERQNIANQLHLGNRQLNNELTLGQGRLTADQNIAQIQRQAQVAAAIQAANAQRHGANQQLAGSNYAADQRLAGIQDTNRVNYDLGLLDANTRQYEVDLRTSADRDIAVTGAEAQRDVAETQAGRYRRLGVIDSYGQYIPPPTGHYQESDLARANQALIARIQAGQIQDRVGTIQAQDRAAGLQAAEYAIDNPYGLAAFTGGGGAGLERSSVLADIGRILALQGSGGTASTPAQAAEQNAILARIQASGGLSDESQIANIQTLGAVDNPYSFVTHQQSLAGADQVPQDGNTNRGVRQGEVLSPATSQGDALGQRQVAPTLGEDPAIDLLRRTQLAVAAPQVRGQTLDFLSNPAGLGAAVQLGGQDYVNQLLGLGGGGAGTQQAGQTGAGTRSAGNNIKQLADQALIDAFNDPNKQTDGASIFGNPYSQLSGQSQATFNQLSNPQQGVVYGASAAQGIDPTGVQRELNRNTPNARERSYSSRFRTV